MFFLHSLKTFTCKLRVTSAFFVRIMYHMNFIARAGGIIDQSHRLAGILLIIIICETFLIMSMGSKISNLSDKVDRLTYRREVYVVPGSAANFYTPTQDTMLLEDFTDHIVQSLNTFTYENVEEQYKEVRLFFTSRMLAYTDAHFKKQIKHTRSLQRSALFVPDRQSLKTEDITEKGKKLKSVTIRGSFNEILGGSVVSVYPKQINLKLRKVMVTATNPFGFQLESYIEKQIKD